MFAGPIRPESERKAREHIISQLRLRQKELEKRERAEVVPGSASPMPYVLTLHSQIETLSLGLCTRLGREKRSVPWI